MNILLVAVNAKYIHSNLAVYSLKSYAKEYEPHINLAEYTINHRVEYILQEVYQKKPDVLCLSCYIWNYRYMQELMIELHKLMPKLPIWVGGPEVSYEPEEFLKEYPMVTGVMIGEGEATFLELCQYYVNQFGKSQVKIQSLSEAVEFANAKKQEKEALLQISGLAVRSYAGKVIRTSKREALSMDELPFCYDNMKDFKNRIIYYETSRGCPFSCSYCLSSIERGLRFRSMELVKKELLFFLKHEIPQVKFVDRTFNCNHQHAIEIWRFLKEHDNKITNFHFEISADLLTEEEIVLISSMRPGLIQLEIGVQSTNQPTIQEIHRTMNLSRLEQVVEKVQQAGNIHQHLDLIAGLPLEDFNSFQRSFDEIYRLKPEQLQLGFLKVLKGSYLYEHQKEYSLIYQEYPPYEVMATQWLTYEEVLDIKLVEEMLEVYYNSGQFEMTMKVVELCFQHPFELYWRLGKFYQEQGLLAISHSRIRRSEILLDFMSNCDEMRQELYKETLTFDLYYRENMKTRPKWAPQSNTFKEITREFCKNGKLSHIEPFYYDMEEILVQKSLTQYPHRNQECGFYLFSYEEKNPLTGQAAVMLVKGK
ncbi:MAG: B12-binding domain-containing radical SAM protein [Lachnospiraceae bacterium]